MSSLKTFFNLLRGSNWIKNFFIFIPAFFGRKMADVQTATQLLTGFGCFCLCASLVYILNDLVDAPKDRLHPVKKHRAIASGKVSPAKAKLVFAVLAAITIALAILFLPPPAQALLAVYVALNFLYSFFLKNQIIIDFFSIGVFFELRLFYGGLLAGVAISHWLAIVVFILATLIALGKRRDDVLLVSAGGDQPRKTAGKYNLAYLDAMLITFSSLLCFVYIIYTTSDWVIANFHPFFYVTSLFVTMGISKYLYLVFVENQGGDPIKILLKDPFVRACIFLWFLSVMLFIYVLPNAR